MTEEEATELVIGVLARHCGIASYAITPQMHVQDDLGLDSIDAAELLIVLEEHTGSRFELEKVEDIETVADIVRKLVEEPALAELMATGEKP
jgi:acyl carrier protein